MQFFYITTVTTAVSCLSTKLYFESQAEIAEEVAFVAGTVTVPGMPESKGMAVAGCGFTNTDDPVIGLQTETISGVFFQFNRIEFKTDPMGVIIAIYLAYTIADRVSPTAGLTIKLMQGEGHFTGLCNCRSKYLYVVY